MKELLDKAMNKVKDTQGMVKEKISEYNKSVKNVESSLSQILKNNTKLMNIYNNKV